MWAKFDGEHVAGAAKRRRATPPCISEVCTDERRHGPVRVQAPHLTRSEYGQGHGQVPEALFPQEPGTQHFTLDDDDSVPELGGSRPDRIDTLSGPQERDLWRTMEQIVDAVPLVPLLDDPVPQIVEQLQDVMRFFDTLLPVPEQVIAAPKILLDDVPMRTAVRDTPSLPFCSGL